MREQKSGLIINITSIAGYMGLPYRGIYSASKGALELVSEAISIEVKSFGIKVVTIAPGEFATAIASHRYHAPIIEGSVYKTSYENSFIGLYGEWEIIDRKSLGKKVELIFY